MPPAAFVRSRFDSLPLIAILRGRKIEDIPPLMQALLAGGILNVEVTMNSGGAPDQIRAALDSAAGRLNIGAGTVTTLDELETALGAGASFIVTPTVVPEVIAACVAADVPVFPGAFTPTEAVSAWRSGATMVKLFPADVLGPGFIRSLLGPFPDIKLLPTGGITAAYLPRYLEAGAAGFGIGGPLFDRKAIAQGGWTAVEARARAFREAYQQARAKLDNMSDISAS